MKQSLKIYEALHWASSFLTTYQQEPTIAEIVLKYVLQVNRSTLYQMLREELPPETEEAFKALIYQAVTGLPVQYITGEEGFYGRRFVVNNNVLIPRPETEELVYGFLQRIEKNYTNRSSISVVDIGTGSGAIAITLALENENLEVTAIDLSGEALKVAKENGSCLGAKVLFLEGDLAEPLLNENMKVDAVIANPPYISTDDFQQLARNVRDFEPTLALVGGVSGYELYERLVMQLPRILNHNGLIAFEVGVGQSQQVASLIKEQFPQAKTEIVFDINGKDRMVFATT